MKELEITVCQGIGDIFWVYQQFAPHADSLRFRVQHVQGGSFKSGSRATEFIRSLPKVTGVTAVVGTDAEYRAIAEGTFDAAKVIAASGGRFGSNAPLERGIRIEAICPDVPIQETVDIPTRTMALPAEFVTLYVCGATVQPDVIARVGIWSVSQWVTFVREFWQRAKPGVPLLVIGADYDRVAAEQVTAGLTGVCDEIQLHINRPIAQACHLLSRTSLFLGYQSGLNVIADQFDREQVMVYFPFLLPMFNSWPKRRNIETKKYQPFIFSRPPEEVASEVRWN